MAPDRPGRRKPCGGDPATARNSPRRPVVGSRSTDRPDPGPNRGDRVRRAQPAAVAEPGCGSPRCRPDGRWRRPRGGRPDRNEDGVSQTRDPIERAGRAAAGRRTPGDPAVERSGGQSGPAPPAAGTQHGPSAPGRHPVPEAVALGPTALVGLIGPLHDVLSADRGRWVDAVTGRPDEGGPASSNSGADDGGRRWLSEGHGQNHPTMAPATASR